MLELKRLRLDFHSNEGQRTDLHGYYTIAVGSAAFIVVDKP